THAMKLLEIFREEQQSMALVVDEYGEIQGLVTISDLMGAVVGRLQAADHSAHQVADGHQALDFAVLVHHQRHRLLFLAEDLQQLHRVG
ncbi:CBS domain-containing protein, partial [Pseudomonas syringae pv. tagetis]